MKNKHYYVFLFSIIASFVFLFGSCKHDGGGKRPDGKDPQLATFKVQFDSSLIQCNENSSSGKVINSGGECKEGDILLFTALLANGNEVETWFFDGKPRAGNTFITCTYPVNKADIGTKKIINVSFKAANLTVCFDSGITCKRNIFGSVAEVPSGSICVPDTYIEFTAALEPTETVDCWVVGEKDQKDKTSQTYSYKVNSSDKNDSNIIKVSVKKRDVKSVTLIFDNTVLCKKGIFGSGDQVSSGDSIKEKEYVQFSAQLEDGKIVQNWSLNGKIQASETSETFSYKVDPNDADENGQIRVEFTFESAFKVQFDPSLIKCNENSGSGKEIKSGDACKEGDILFFTALLAGENKAEMWSIGSSQQQGNSFTTCTYHVKKADANTEKVINVSFKVANLTICFDSNITCKEGILGNGREVLSGSASTPDTWLTFTAILESTETVNCWVIGDKDQEYEVNSTYSYKVKDSDKNENNIIKIGTKRRELKTVTLIFDGTITCKKNIIGTGDKVKSGEVIGEKEWVQFTAVLEDGKVVQNWSLNGKVQASATSKTFSYKVDPNDADENGQIRVEFTQKDAKKITIKFDSNITCTKAGDEISSGTSVQEQDFLKFTANLEEGQIMDHWYLNDKEQEYETSRIFFYTVDSEMANDEGVIKVSFKVK